MNSTQQEIMAQLAAEIQTKWGRDAFRRGDELVSSISLSPLPIGIAKLDLLLEGGILPGQITEFSGVKTSGVASLAFQAIVASQANGEKVIYVDPSNTFNPKNAAACGADLANLLIVRPETGIEGIEIATDLINRYAAGLLVFGYAADLRNEKSEGAIRRLVSAIRRSSCAFLFLNRAPDPKTMPLHSQATTQIHLKLRKWRKHWGVTSGYVVKITVVKHAGRDCNRSVTLRFDAS